MLRYVHHWENMGEASGLQYISSPPRKPDSGISIFMLLQWEWYLYVLHQFYSKVETQNII